MLRFNWGPSVCLVERLKKTCSLIWFMCEINLWKKDQAIIIFAIFSYGFFYTKEFLAIQLF